MCFVVPTRNREDELARTLAVIGSLDLDGSVLVIDNGSDDAARVPGVLANGARVDLVRSEENLGAAARNLVIGRTDADWVVMLDDDSAPMDAGLIGALRDAPSDAAAVSADIFLPEGSREMGGLPEVFVGCGVAIRRSVFEALGGYDASFGYYAEEYDLSARMIGAGHRVVFDSRFRVLHRKVSSGRDMDRIVEKLVRNNGWVMQRYAPDGERRAQLREVRRRARWIGGREGAIAGYARGLVELRATVRGQARAALSQERFDRFTGLAAAREAVRAAIEEERFDEAAIVARGKNTWCVERALTEAGIELVAEDRAGVLVIGTMSPGPMLDAARAHAGCGRRVVLPWAGAAPGAVATAAAP